MPQRLAFPIPVPSRTEEHDQQHASWAARLRLELRRASTAAETGTDMVAGNQKSAGVGPPAPFTTANP